MRRQPPPGRAVERGDVVRAGPTKLCLEEFPEELVVSEDVLAPLVDDEGVRSRQLVENPGRVVAAAEERREVGGQQVGKGRPEEEGAPVLRLSIEHLAHEVVGHGAVGAGEVFEEALGSRVLRQ